ncbi:MAG: RHS repeat-associated core domain-containing protein, partial [Acidobacteria bacterium]|nr:RHS repeat-associated core domain-containing protein [Acidobacteriota bacterium]
NRVEKSVTQNGQTVVTKYLVDTNNLTGYAQVVEEIQNNVVSRQYSYGLDLINQRQLINNNRVVSFYGYDGHGSIRYLTDINGAITDTYDYDAYGLLINQTGNTPNNYLYAGEQYDFDLGLYYNRARYLEVNRGRFWSQDSFEGINTEPASLHKYLYAADNPVNNIDPSGNLFFGPSGLVELQLAQQTHLTAQAQRAHFAYTVYQTIVSILIVGVLLSSVSSLNLKRAIGTAPSVNPNPSLDPNTVETEPGQPSDQGGGEVEILYHGTTSNQAAKIVGNDTYPRKGFRPGYDGKVFFSEDFATAKEFARIGGGIFNGAKSFTVIEFTIPKQLSINLGLNIRYYLGFARGLRPISVGTGYERILESEFVPAFNAAFQSNIITARRIKLLDY